MCSRFCQGFRLLVTYAGLYLFLLFCNVYNSYVSSLMSCTPDASYDTSTYMIVANLTKKGPGMIYICWLQKVLFKWHFIALHQVRGFFFVGFLSEHDPGQHPKIREQQ